LALILSLIALLLWNVLKSLILFVDKVGQAQNEMIINELNKIEE
jgi:hypothetical protein